MVFRDWFHFAIFTVLVVATGFSITLGYHRLFSHPTFRARLPVRLFALIFGAAAFENSVLMWASDHRRHHKYVDHDEDPYDISRGFFMRTSAGFCSNSCRNLRSITWPI
jgi:stearoyl-CoA desaturase (delta-9 desaturase)